LAEENSHGLSNVEANAKHWWEVSERERQVQFEELTILQTRGSELYLTIVDPPWLRNHLSEGMRLAALLHIEMARELAALRAVVPSAVESALGNSPD
jgi:hypothetical protein